MSEKLGDAVLELRTDDSKLKAGIKDAKRDAEGLAQKFDSFGGRARNAGGMLSLGLTAPIVAFAVQSVGAARESAEAMGQVEAALKSMGGASGRTSEQLAQLAESQMGQSLYDDDEILRKVTANLLTFGNVAGDAFDRGQQAALDMAARLGGDLQGATLMIGKALNDPIAGITALTRTGVQFTAQQKAQIEAMTEAGDRAGAQALILAELERQFGGAAKAMRDADPAAAMKQSFATFQEEVGAKILPLLPPLMDGLGGVLDAFGALPSGVQSFVVGALLVGAAIGPMLMGVGALASGIGALLPILAALGPVIGVVSTALLGLLANPIVLGAAAIIAGIYLAWQNWDKIAPIISAVGGAISAWWTGNVKPVMDWVLEKLQAVANFWRDVFGVSIQGVVKMVSALLRGDFAGAWAAAKNAVSGMVGAALKLLNSLAPGAIEAMRSMYLGVKQWTQDKLSAVFDWLKGKLEAVGKWFYDLYDKVVGHSYWPDLVDGVAAHAKRFGPEMVDPVRKALADVESAFAGAELDLPAPGVDLPGSPPTAPTDDPSTKRNMADGFRQTFIDGVKAALSGDLRGFLQRFFENAAGRALDRAISKLWDVLGDGLGKALDGLFGGGFGDIFSGFFAKGGMIPSGTFGIVGERGPEPVIGTNRGAKVLPNSSLRGFVGGGSGGGLTRVEIVDTTGLFRTRVTEISGEQVSQGISSYDRVVGDRVRDHLERRG